MGATQATGNPAVITDLVIPAAHPLTDGDVSELVKLSERQAKERDEWIELARARIEAKFEQMRYRLKNDPQYTVSRDELTGHKAE